MTKALVAVAATVTMYAAEYKDLIYASTQQKQLALDLYIPDGAPKRPLVVWIHGGAWRAGSRAKPPALYLTAQGYAVASISYRFSQEAVFPAQIHDCKAAIRWLRANALKYGYDATRIGVWGASAGGHLAALLGTSGGVKGLEGDLGNARESSTVQAVVDFFGPTDLPQMSRFPGTMDHDAPDSPESPRVRAMPSGANSLVAASPCPSPVISRRWSSTRNRPLGVGSATARRTVRLPRSRAAKRRR